MSYVILVNEDNTLYGSQKERVMQRSKLVNTLSFVVDPIYKGRRGEEAVVEYIEDCVAADHCGSDTVLYVS